MFYRKILWATLRIDGKYYFNSAIFAKKRYDFHFKCRRVYFDVRKHVLLFIRSHAEIVANLIHASLNKLTRRHIKEDGGPLRILICNGIVSCFMKHVLVIACKHNVVCLYVFCFIDPVFCTAECSYKSVMSRTELCHGMWYSYLKLTSRLFIVGLSHNTTSNGCWSFVKTLIQKVKYMIRQGIVQSDTSVSFIYNCICNAAFRISLQRQISVNATSLFRLLP